MAVIPTTRDAMLAFYNQHQPVWQAAFAQIGLTGQQAAELRARLDDAAAKRAVAEAARAASRTATQDLNDSVAAVRAYGASLVGIIRGYAEATEDPVVYSAAQLPPPAPPSPLPAPTPPTSLIADPNALGTITLRWKGTLARKQVFAIERSVDGGPWESRGTFGVKEWTDARVPMNSGTIQYRVFGQRGLARSADAAVAVVNFGNLPRDVAAAFRSSGPLADAA